MICQDYQKSCFFVEELCSHYDLSTSTKPSQIMQQEYCYAVIFHRILVCPPKAKEKKIITIIKYYTHWKMPD